MALRIDALDEQVHRYVPTFAGERDKAKSDPAYHPVVFHLRPMTAAEAEKYDEFKTRFDPESGLVTIEPHPETDAAIFATHVRQIDHLTVGDQPLRDGKEFRAALERLPRAFVTLYREVLTAIRDLSRLSEGEIKN